MGIVAKFMGNRVVHYLFRNFRVLKHSGNGNEGLFGPGVHPDGTKTEPGKPAKTDKNRIDLRHIGEMVIPDKV